MPFSAGQRLSASQLNLIQPKTYEATQTGNGGGSQTITTSLVDSLNASVTFITSTNNAIAVVMFEIDCNVTVAIASPQTIIIGQLNIDGVDDNSRQALFSMDDVHRLTVAQRYRITLGGSGSHTIKLRIQKTGAGGTAVAVDGHTGLTVTVYENF